MNSGALVRHLLIIEDQNSRRTISLEDHKYSLGRHSDNSIIIYSKQASRRHATLMRKNSSQTNQFSFWILDGDLEGNKSNNGIFVNGNKCSVHELKDGDLINFGCDVNASYHILSNVGESLIDKPNNNTPYIVTKEITNNPLSFNDQKTLILSDINSDEITNKNDNNNNDDDDTFQDQAYLDPLTDLPNRTLFNEYLSIALGNAKRHQNYSAILLLNIEKFKNINETFNYHVGDQVLKAVAKRLHGCLRSGDIVARWGGDEFIILLPQLTNENNINKIIERILRAIKEPLEIEKYLLNLDIYIGISLYPQDGEAPKILLQQAEINLYNNKQEKLDFQRFEKIKVAQQVSRLSKVEYRLHQALEKQEFSLFYQPQVNVNTAKIEAMEAFLRWNHPTKGLVFPSQFLPWLDKTDLIFPLTQWILKTACRQNQVWQNAGLSFLPISINISQGQFQHPQFVQLLANILSATKIAPHCLELEVTEATILNNLDLARKILHNLQQMGIYLSIDNFGKGLTSIGYLQELPFHKIKIDQSFIKKLTENPEDNAMISALIALGKSFNLRVVAEGVETQQQLEILRSLNCEAMQGYRFSQPLTPDDATKFLTFHRTVGSSA